MATCTSIQKVNGDILQKRLKTVKGPWRGGRFMSLSLISQSVSTYAYSKLINRCNVINPRVDDITLFNSTSKSFIYADLLDELLLYRHIKDGGLGLLHIQ